MDHKVINEIVMPMVLQVVECIDATHLVVSPGDNNGECLVFLVEILGSVNPEMVSAMHPGDYVQAMVTTTQYVIPGRHPLLAYSTLSGVKHYSMETPRPVPEVTNP